MTVPALVILAAGLGSRYGGNKQMAGVGPDGEWLLEYAIHDALAAGFADVIMVTRAALDAPLQQRLAPRLRGRATLHLVEQTLDKLPAGCVAPGGRNKPLGTGHALWCCTPLLHGPFAVINADDYYGHAAFGLLAQHFADHATPAMVGYQLAATLSEAGGVNRGVCAVDDSGHLAGVREYIDIARRDGTLTGTAPGGARESLAPATTVSLNCWGLWPDLLPELERGLRDFLPRAGERGEYFLPHAITAYLAGGSAPLAVLPSHDAWMGMTYPADRARVTATLAAFHATGAYPTPLWPQP